MVGLIGMSCGETARFSEPYDSLMNLARPAGWGFRQYRSMSIAENWNQLARDFLTTDAQWLLLTNDDHVYPPDTLVKLLAHNLDAVCALYVSRQAPFLPVLADRVAADGGAHPLYLQRGERGLRRIAMCGDGCLLLKRRVLEAIPEPRWTLANYAPDACDHDNAFCARVLASGFTLWCDYRVAVNHLAVVPVVPFMAPDGQWQTALLVGPNAVIVEPQPQSPLSLVS